MNPGRHLERTSNGNNHSSFMDSLRCSLRNNSLNHTARRQVLGTSARHHSSHSANWRQRAAQDLQSRGGAGGEASVASWMLRCLRKLSSIPTCVPKHI